MSPRTISHKNVLQAISDVEALAQDARLITAGNLLRQVDEYLTRGEDSDRKAFQAAFRLVYADLKESFDQLRTRAAECAATLSDWHAADWILAQTFMGVTTWYKHGTDGSLWMKMQGRMDGVRVVNQLAIVREVDLFHQWLPFCSKSYLLKRLGIVELLTYFNTALPGMTRDCVLHAYGCDSVAEHSCILIQGRSVNTWEGVDIPRADGWRHKRMHVHAFKAKIELLSPTCANTSIVANIDPKAHLPKSAVNFLLRRVAGMMLYCLRQAARRIEAGENDDHRARIAADRDFYTHWLQPRIERFYRMKGWIEDERSNTEHIRSTCGPESTRKWFRGPTKNRMPRGSSERRPFLRLAHVRMWRKMRVRPRSKRRRKNDDAPRLREEPKVESLGVEPRLLQKWQARKELKAAGILNKRSTSSQLLFNIGKTVSISLVQRLCWAAAAQAYRLKVWLIVAIVIRAYLL